MDEGDFRERLGRITRETVEFTRRLVWDELPDNYVYKIFTNKHGADKPLIGDAVVYPQDTLPDHEFIGPLAADDAVKYLWRHGKVPEWINLSVDSVACNTTIIKLWCCGHFTSVPANGYNAMVNPKFSEMTPFESHSPVLPFEWKLGDEKFWLHDSPGFVGYDRHF